MMKLNNEQGQYAAFIMLMVLSCPLFANQFGGSASVLTGKSDNAFKSNEEKTDERQDQYQLNFKGDYTNSLLNLDGEYEATEFRFDKDSQENEQFLEGNASLLVGKSYHPAELLITHTRKTLLSSPDDLALKSNEDEREIFSISPTLRTKIGRRDRVFLTGTATDIRFLKNDKLDSSRKGGTLGWTHGISSIQSLMVNLQKTDVEFDHFIAANYTYKSATLLYSAELRHLSYEITLGQNKSETASGEQFSSPTYGISVNYTNGFNAISLSSNKIITDSSQGGANANSINGLPNSDGSRSDQVDQIERLNSELQWSTSAVCEKCSLAFSIFQRDEDYLTLDQSAKSLGRSASLHYRLSSASALSINTSKSSSTFTGFTLGRDYNIRLSRVEYTYAFINGLGLKLFAQQEKRTSDVFEQRYRENYFGGGLDYTF